MQFSNSPIGTLYAKVSLVRTPYNNTVRAIRIMAADFTPFNINTAQHYEETGTEASVETINSIVAKMQQGANARNVECVTSAQVLKLMTKNTP